MGFRLCIYLHLSRAWRRPPGRLLSGFLERVKHEPCQPAMPRLDKAIEPEKQAKQADFAQKMSSDA